MADEVKKINEGYTEFGNTNENEFYYPIGPLGRFFAKFFARKAIPVIKKEQELKNGDTIINPDVVNTEDGVLGGINRTPIMPQLEMNRKRRYKDYEEMDDYPEIAATFDIYSDDSTLKGIRNENWKIQSESEDLIKEVEKLFDRMYLQRYLWDIVRNTVKYGDCFVEVVLDINKKEEGLKKIKILNPAYIIRVENEFGYLKEFLQEIPSKTNIDNFGDSMYYGGKPNQYIKLDKNQIIHFRLHTSDPAFYPYGKSIAAACHRTFKSLRMMEDAMMVYRLARAPERRIFYIDTGNLPTQKAELFMERIKEKFKKEKFFNSNTGNIDARFNPLSVDEDYFVPTRNGAGTKIDTLRGAENLGEVDDVKYFRDKLLAALKIPKDYIVEFDKSPERKANLAQLDVKFARVILRVQKSIEVGLENIAKRHLQLKNYPPSLIKDLRIKLPDPSDMFAKRKLDLDEQKTRVIQAVKGLGLLSNKTIYKEYYDMSEEEIDRELEAIKEEQEQAMADQAEQQAAAAAAAPAPAAPQAGAAPGYGEAGGQEGMGNVQPTATGAPVAEGLEKIKNIVNLSNEERLIIERILLKQKNKN